MRRTDKQIDNPVLIDEILRQGRELSLAMIDGDKPYVIRMNYGYHDGSLYLHCATQGKSSIASGQTRWSVLKSVKSWNGSMVKRPASGAPTFAVWLAGEQPESLKIEKRRSEVMTS